MRKKGDIVSTYVSLRVCGSINARCFQLLPARAYREHSSEALELSWFPRTPLLLLLLHWYSSSLSAAAIRDQLRVIAQTHTKMRALVLLVTLACFAGAQHQALIGYLERRLLAIEVRVSIFLPADPWAPEYL